MFVNALHWVEESQCVGLIKTVLECCVRFPPSYRGAFPPFPSLSASAVASQCWIPPLQFIFRGSTRSSTCIRNQLPCRHRSRPSSTCRPCCDSHWSAKFVAVSSLYLPPPLRNVNRFSKIVAVYCVSTERRRHFVGRTVVVLASSGLSRPGG